MPYLNILLRNKWQAYAALFLPFIFVLIFTDGLTEQFKTFHFQDESLHYLVSVEFYRQLVAAPFGDYLSSVTPLYYLVMNALGELTGNSIVAMRWLTMLLSVSAIVLFYHLMKHRDWPKGHSLLAASVFSLSPYVFGSSFILLNDNMALFFLLSAVVVGAGNQENRLSVAAMSYGLAGLAILTRQNYVWVYAMLFAIEVSASRLKVQLWSKILLASVSLVPTLLLFALWGGVTPPSHQAHHIAVGLNWRSVLLLLALLGFYATFLVHWRTWLQFVRDLRDSRRHLFVFNAGAVFVTAAVYILEVSKTQYGSDGYFLSMLRHTPYVHNSSIFVYVFAILGVAATEILIKERGLTYLLVLFAFAITMLPSIMMFQKYYDYMMLLWLLYGMRGKYEINIPGALLLIAGFVLYHVVYQVMF